MAKISLNELKEQLANQKAKALAEKGLRPFFNIKAGENQITIKNIEPEQREFEDGTKKIVWELSDGTDLAINPRNPVMSSIVDALVKGETTITIIKSGKGLETRMELKK